MGNPLSYRDGMSFAWENGRSLKSISTGEPNIRRLNPFRYRGYVYDNETGLYYLQSRYYDPITGRFLNADETAFLGANGTVLSGDLFAYCENDSVNCIDTDGYWCEKLSGFKKTKKGFKVYESIKFLSRTYCLLYASDFLRIYGKWKWYGKTYSGMTALRIAQEIWFHALAYYIGKPLQKILSWCNMNWNWLNDKVSRASKIDVNSDDNRAWLYKAVWYVGQYIKIKSAMRSFGVMRYAKLIIL